MRQAEVEATEEDWEALAPSGVVRASVLSVMSLGFVSFVLGVQVATMGGLGLSAWTVSMFILGLATLGFGLRMKAQLRASDVIVGAVLGGSFVLIGGVWLVGMFASGLASLLALAVPPHGVLTAVLCLAALAPLRRADAARTRLRAAGFEA